MTSTMIPIVFEVGSQEIIKNLTRVRSIIVNPWQTKISRLELHLTNCGESGMASVGIVRLWGNELGLWGRRTLVVTTYRERRMKLWDDDGTTVMEELN